MVVGAYEVNAQSPVGDKLRFIANFLYWIRAKHVIELSLKEKLQAIVDLLVTLNGSWTANKVLHIARLMGLEVRRDYALAVLGAIKTPKREPSYKTVTGRTRFAILERDNFTCRYCGRSAPDVVLHVDHVEPVSLGGSSHPNNLVTACATCNLGKSNTPLSEPIREPVWEPLREPVSEATGNQVGNQIEPASGSLFPKPLISPNHPFLPNSVSEINTTARTRTKKPADLSWVQPLRDATRDIAKVTIAGLSLDQRDTLARYHALNFSGCTVKESLNKSTATKIAAGLASMARNKTYGDLTVETYVSLARKVHELRGGARWFDPWLIRSAVEFE